MYRNDCWNSSVNTYVDHIFRHYVISQLKKLEVLDDTTITREERKEAERIYAQHLPHVPTTFQSKVHLLSPSKTVAT